MNRMVLPPNSVCSPACFITSLISLMPLVTAENVMNRAFVVRAEPVVDPLVEEIKGRYAELLATVHGVRQ